MDDKVDLEAVLKELRMMEPIFHTRAFGITLEDFSRRMPDDYWEIGASGARYDRAFILQQLASTPPVDAESAGWRTSEYKLRELSEQAFLLTYRLQQGDRITLRSTLWRRTVSGWQILFHQGTVVSHG